MKVVTFGEIMLRLNPAGYGRFLQAESFDATYAGADANVAVALAGFGIEAAYVSKVPEHEIGQAAINALRRFGVSTEHVLRGGERLGVYFLEKGASQRGGKVIYDRAGSAIATASRTEFDWKCIFDGADWFHLTGITPALSPELAEAALDAVKCAKEMGLTVSMDLNYRAKLWSREAAAEVLARLLPYVDYCKDPLWYEDGERDVSTLVGRMMRDFSLRGVIVTEREAHSASDHSWSATYYTEGKSYSSRTYEMHVVDRVGGGDAFSAGWIYALLNGYDPQAAVEFATAAGCLKHSIEGDFNLVSVDEVKSLAEGSATGRVQR